MTLVLPHQPITLLRGRPRVPLFVFMGESNSGGYAVNASLSAGELAERTNARIFNNNRMVFENLDIGTNNLTDHAGFTDNSSHGLENGLANVFATRTNFTRIHILKLGQGGDMIDTWAVGHGSGYWAKAVARAYKVRMLELQLGVQFVPYVFYSQGINDAIGFSIYNGGSGQSITDPDVWKAATIDLQARLRALFRAPRMPIVMTKFQTPLAVQTDINTKIDEIVAADPYTKALTTTGLEIVDDNHWNHIGFRRMAERFFDQWVEDYYGGSALAAPGISPDGGEISGSQSVSMSGPSEAEIRYTQDGSDPLANSTLYTGAFDITDEQTIKAISVRRNKKNSAVEDSVFTVPAAGSTWESADASGHFTLTNNGLTAVRSTSSNGYRALRISTGKSSGKWYVELKLDVTGGNGYLIAGFAVAGVSLATYIGNAASGAGVGFGARYVNGFTAGTDARLAGGALTTDDIYNFAIDVDAGKCWVGYKNAWQLSGDPASGANPYATFSSLSDLRFAISLFAANGDDGTWTLKALSSDQTYSPPSGFTAWG